MIMAFGDKMKSAYLERVKFRAGVDLRIQILAIDKVVAQQFHYLSFEEYKGGHECVGGVCCRCFGAPSQRYYMPVWVYSDPARTYDGALQALSLTPGQYEDFVKLEIEYKKSGYSITQFDFTASTKEQGRGLRTNYNVVMGNPLMSWAPAEFKQKVQDSLQAFYTLAETSMQKPMSPDSWMKLIDETGTAVPQIDAPQTGYNQAALPPGGFSGQGGFGAQTLAQPVAAVAQGNPFPQAQAQPASPFPQAQAQPASPFPQAQAQPASPGNSPFPPAQPGNSPFPPAQQAAPIPVEPQQVIPREELEAMLDETPPAQA